MENKYFTPEISDLYIGYECEKNCNIIGAHSTEVEQVWLSYTIHYDRDFTNIESDIVDYRVPYLTNEQIEAEGWEYVETDINSIFTFKKSKYILYCNFITKKISIDFLVNNGGTSTLFTGECKDINTFRKIIKLLEI